MNTTGQSIREMQFFVSDQVGKVSALFLQPRNAWGVLVFGHGAGAGMHHPFMEALSDRLGYHGLGTFRYQFPYMDQGRRRPDSRSVLLATVRRAVQCGNEVAAGLPLFAGGKSMGGRMTSLAASEEELLGVRGLVFFGFPLHAAGRPSTSRGNHLDEVPMPLLFLQGTRDKLADLELLKPVCLRLGGKAELRIVDGADHSFKVLKRSGRNEEEVLDELAKESTDWLRRL